MTVIMHGLIFPLLDKLNFNIAVTVLCYMYMPKNIETHF